MSATIRSDGFLPLHVSEDDSLVEEGDGTDMGLDDIALIVAIRERERNGRRASAEWLRAALGAIRSTKRANRYLEAAIENGVSGNGRNGSTNR